jgi:hypothetical protein
MMLPKGDGAYVDRTKIIDYLLSLSHPDGRSKAEFFRRFGFKTDVPPRFRRFSPENSRIAYFMV